MKAIQLESAAAVSHWWGVSIWKVNDWRKVLGVPQNNPGTLRLRKLNGHSDFARRGLKACWTKARDPIRCGKISAAHKGKARPQHVLDALIRANTGRKPSVRSRRKMSEARRLRGTWPPAAGKPWAAWETKLLYEFSIREVMKKTGRSLYAVKSQRLKLKLPDGRRRENRRGHNGI